MGDITSFLITIAEILGALVAIITALVTFEKWSKGKLTKWLLKSVLDEVGEIKEHLEKVELDNLKLVIMSDAMPIEERLSAGKRYINKGGNGGVKIHVKVLEEEYESNLKNH